MRVLLAILAVTLAGSNSNCGFADGFGDKAKFNYPYGITFNPKDGYCYIADFNNNRIRKVSPQGKILVVSFLTH